jgi:hypothetical protein
MAVGSYIRSDVYYYCMSVFCHFPCRCRSHSLESSESPFAPCANRVSLIGKNTFFCRSRGFLFEVTCTLSLFSSRTKGGI